MFLTPYDIAAYIFQKGYATERSLRGDYRCCRPPFSENEITFRDFGKDVMSPLRQAIHLGIVGKGRLDIAPNRLNRRIFYPIKRTTEVSHLKYHVRNIVVARGVERALRNAGHQIIDREIMPSSSLYHQVLTKWDNTVEIRTSNHHGSRSKTDFHIYVLTNNQIEGLGRLKNLLCLKDEDVDSIADTLLNIPEPIVFMNIRKDAPCTPTQSSTVQKSSQNTTLPCS